MPIERPTSLDDPRLAAYRNLKDRELAREGRRFLAEGEQLVRRLIASDFPVESVLISERCAGRLSGIVPAGVPLFILPETEVHRVIGFKFHSGILACGVRKAGPSLEEALPAGEKMTVVVCPETSNAENLGALVRISAALGADAMVLGPQCCDPFWRQSVRVSMGSVFTLPLVQSDDLLRDLQRLRSQWNCELIATVADSSAQPLNTARFSRRRALLFGNEAQGLPDELISLCDRRVTIPMRLGTDSLNVSVSAAVFLFHLTRDV
jgi:tRNA G18 (ribose-2'-O)-methylase SpoU